MSSWRDAFQQQQMRDMAWGCALASQMGFAIAGPVLVCLAVGYLLDIRLGTLPWIALALMVVGAVSGPIIAYRWVTKAVQQRFTGREPGEPAGEENLN